MGGLISRHLVDVVEAAEPARDREAEAVQQLRLGFVGFGHATPGDAAWLAAAR